MKELHNKNAFCEHRNENKEEKCEKKKKILMK